MANRETAQAALEFAKAVSPTPEIRAAFDQRWREMNSEFYSHWEMTVQLGLAALDGIRYNRWPNTGHDPD